MTWAPNYATPGQLAEYTRIGDSADDPWLRLCVTAASRAVDRTCGRQFGIHDQPVTRYYSLREPPPGIRREPGGGRWWALIDDVTTTEDLAVTVESRSGPRDLTAEAPSLLRPRNAAADGRPFTEFALPTGMAPVDPEDGLQVTARFGWAEIPSAVVEATLLQASRLVSRRDAPFGVTGSPDSGTETRLLAKVDPDVAVALQDYRRRWLGV